VIVIDLDDAEAHAVVAADAGLLQDDRSILADQGAIDLGLVAGAVDFFLEH
jgi:hypothetical protein